MHATQKQATGLTTPADTLRDAAKYLARYGWIQGCYYDQSATVFTPAACVVGAIGMVCYGGPSETPVHNFDDPGFADFSAAYSTLLWYLILTCGSGCDPYKFNDTKGRTIHEVLDALKAAADMWDGIYSNPDDQAAAAVVAEFEATFDPEYIAGGAA